MVDGGLAWQASLLDAGAGGPRPDPSFAGLTRRQLDPATWIDLAPTWLAGSDDLFDQLLAEAPWQSRRRHMYGRVVDEPRRTAWWQRGDPGAPSFPAVREMGDVLSDRYGVAFDSVGLNLYRDGRDSVAWHGDRIAKTIVDPVVALVSLGHPRRFLLRPAAGGPATALVLERGDLLVMGGSCQRTWRHTVPKMARAGPRISVTFRHGQLFAAPSLAVG